MSTKHDHSRTPCIDGHSMLNAPGRSRRRYEIPIGPVPRIGPIVGRITPVWLTSKENHLSEVWIVGQCCAPQAHKHNGGGGLLSPGVRCSIPLPCVSGYADVAILSTAVSAINDDLRPRNIVGHAEVRSWNRHGTS